MQKLALLAAGASLVLAQNISTPAQTQTSKDINVVVNVPKAVATRTVSGLIPNSPVLVKPRLIKVTGIGEGVPPVNTVSPAQAKALARRAAIADAYRSLAEKMYGIRLSAKDRIRDLIAQRTEVRTQVYGIIRGAKIDEEVWKDGLYRVTLIVNLDACRWSNYLTAPSIYKCY
jgi:hypothetical protein